LIIWLTGASGAGKTTLAKALVKKLRNWIILDGDDMRDSISVGAGFDEKDRTEHNLRVARLAKVLEKQGSNILVSVIAPFPDLREKVDLICSPKWVCLEGTHEDKTYVNPYIQPDNATLYLGLNTTVEERVESVIENLRLFNVYVFGLPRSGTSMTTHVLELLGIKMVHTSEEEEQKERGDRQYKKNFGEYHPNETGFYEVTKNYFTNYNEIHETPFSGCKMIIPVNHQRFNAVLHTPCKVIMTWREPEEIRQSQMAYYRRGRNIDIGTIRTLLVEEKLKLEKNNIPYIIADYNKLINNPREEIIKIAKFIHAPRHVCDAVDFVNPKQNRFKKEELVDGL